MDKELKEKMREALLKTFPDNYEPDTVDEASLEICANVAMAHYESYFAENPVSYLLSNAIRFLSDEQMQELTNSLNERLNESKLVRVEDAFNKHTAFTLSTFPEATPLSSLAKLEEEIHEVANEIQHGGQHLVLEEYADCVMCLFDSAARCGFTGEQFAAAFEAKYQKNITRTWVKNENNTYSHAKNTPPNSPLNEGEKTEKETDGDSR